MNAKTSITLLILCFLFSVKGFSQTTDTVNIHQSTTVTTQTSNVNQENHDVEQKSSVGFRLGFNISKQQFDQGDLDVNPDSKFGLDLALVFDLPVNTAFSISPEIHWMQKGSKIDDLNGGFEESIQTFNYLEIPVLAKIKFGDQDDNGESGFFVFLGPSLGYLFSATDKDGDGNTNDIDLDDYKRTEVGAHMGAGIKFGIVSIDARYVLGFSNIAHIEDNDQLKVHNRGYGLGIGLIF